MFKRRNLSEPMESLRSEINHSGIISWQFVMKKRKKNNSLTKKLSQPLPTDGLSLKKHSDEQSPHPSTAVSVLSPSQAVWRLALGGKNCLGLGSSLFTLFRWQVLKRNQEPERIRGLPIFSPFRGFPASRIHLEVPLLIFSPAQTNQ